MAGITTTTIENTTEEFCDRVGEHYRTGSKHNFAIAYTVIESSSFPIIAFGVIFFYYKVSSTLYKRMKGKTKETNILPNGTEHTSAVETDNNIMAAEFVEKKIKNKSKKHIPYKPEGQNSNRQRDSGFGISVVFEGTPTCSTVKLFESDHMHLDNTQNIYSGKVMKKDISFTTTHTNVEAKHAKEKPKLDITFTAESTTQQTRVTSGNIHKSIETRIGKNRKTPIRLFFKQHRYTIIFITITITFFITYLPRVTLMLLETIHTDFWIKFQGKPSLQILIFLNRLHIINCIVNPLLYGIFDEKFKHHFIKLFRFKCMKNRVTASNE
ncbi:unnamed protein product [Mytilus coruscus]|uniref:G-protein coupled receptors family 1 profile domain-containing protein n=1 Tax=Mytilus coruscus TaxID=42192 RepID=A0A6J8D6T7_MYTCO|nr:unnamed protein product [Mytilus coruscus]